MDLTTDADWYQLNRSLCCITHDKQYLDCASELYLRIPRWCKVLATFFWGKGVFDDPDTKVIHANNHSSCISDQMSTGYATTETTQQFWITETMQ